MNRAMGGMLDSSVVPMIDYKPFLPVVTDDQKKFSLLMNLKILFLGTC